MYDRIVELLAAIGYDTISDSDRIILNFAISKVESEIKNEINWKEIPQGLENVLLFIAPEVTISPGSKIVITHEGRTGEYSQSGIPAVYPTHQEIVLTVFERWA